MILAELITRVCLVYAAIGLVFALIFAFRGVHRVDPAAHGASTLFRVIVIPGAAALWPWLLRRWFMLRRPPQTGQSA